MATISTQNSTDKMKGHGSKKAAQTKRGRQARSRKSKTTGGLAAQLYQKGKDAVSSAYDSAAQVGARTTKALPDFRGTLDLRPNGRSVYTMMEERPLVVGAVGVGVGMVLAALLPSLTSHRQRR
jgi:hypothetical protein